MELLEIFFAMAARQYERRLIYGGGRNSGNLAQRHVPDVPDDDHR